MTATSSGGEVHPIQQGGKKVLKWKKRGDSVFSRRRKKEIRNRERFVLLFS